MNGKDIVGGFVLLILIYLLVNNSKGSADVINAIGGAVTKTTAALQGRDIG